MTDPSVRELLASALPADLAGAPVAPRNLAAGVYRRAQRRNRLARTATCAAVLATVLAGTASMGALAGERPAPGTASPSAPSVPKFPMSLPGAVQAALGSRYTVTPIASPANDVAPGRGHFIQWLRVTKGGQSVVVRLQPSNVSGDAVQVEKLHSDCVVPGSTAGALVTHPSPVVPGQPDCTVVRAGGFDIFVGMSPRIAVETFVPGQVATVVPDGGGVQITGIIAGGLPDGSGGALNVSELAHVLLDERVREAAAWIARDLAPPAAVVPAPVSGR